MSTCSPFTVGMIVTSEQFCLALGASKSTLMECIAHLCNVIEVSAYFINFAVLY